MQVLLDWKQHTRDLPLPTPVLNPMTEQEYTEIDLKWIHEMNEECNRLKQ